MEMRNQEWSCLARDCSHEAGRKAGLRSPSPGARKWAPMTYVRKLWTQSPSPPCQSNTNTLTASLFSFRFPKLGALSDLKAYQIQTSPFKDEKTKAQGHSERQSKDLSRFQSRVLPCKSLQGSKHYSLPGFSPICDPTLTLSTAAVPNSHLLTPNPQSSVSVPSSLRKRWPPRASLPTSHPPNSFFPLNPGVWGPAPFAPSKAAPSSLTHTPARHRSPPVGRPRPRCPPLPGAAALTPRPLSPVKPLSVEDLGFGLTALPCGGALAHDARAQGRLPVTGPRRPPLLPPLLSPAVAAAATAAGPARPPSLCGG